MYSQKDLAILVVGIQVVALGLCILLMRFGCIINLIFAFGDRVGWFNSFLCWKTIGEERVSQKEIYRKRTQVNGYLGELLTSFKGFRLWTYLCPLHFVK